MSKFEYTWLQQILGNPSWLPGAYTVPYCDVIQRPIDQTPVESSAKVPLPSLQWEACPIELNPHARVSENTLGGVPMQNVGDAVDMWTQSAYGARTPAPLPKPKAGAYWVQGHPCTGAGSGDRHWIGVKTDGTVIEVIVMDGLQKTVFRYGWWKDGQLISGGAVTRSGVALHSHTLQRNDKPHVMLCGLSMYGGGENTDPATRDWAYPRCGQRARLGLEAYLDLMDLYTTTEQRNFLTAARDYGFIFHDKFTSDPTAVGARVHYVSGAQWNGSSIPAMNGALHVGDLELVTS